MAQATRTFRIFVSSTFNDLREERNALQRHVFPRLKQLCVEHGTRFQVIDLRWGVREEAGLDQRTMRICLDEIERCRRASPRPNFVALLGDRYGWQPLPAVIAADEFAVLRAHAGSAADAELLDNNYARDDNGVPPEYFLKPRTIREGQTKEDEEAEWRETETSLRRILTTAVAQASLPDAAREKYEASATEQEILSGALRVDDASEHVFCYFRGLANLEDVERALAEPLPEEDRARNFIDTRGPGASPSPDPAARRSLVRLKERLERQVPHNIRRYRAEWLGGHGAAPADPDVGSAAVVKALSDALGTAVKNARRAPHARGIHLERDVWTELDRLKEELLGPDRSAAPRRERPPVIALDHVPALCADVFLDLSRVILGEIARLEERDSLEKEIDDHEAFGGDRAKIFIGRARVLGNIVSSLAGADTRPLALHGVSGSGKSAVMARAVESARETVPAAVIVQRFIGATPGSSDVRTLIDGLCRQITRVYGGDETSIPSDYRELAEEFPKRLALATRDRPLVVLLDALDQLSDADFARNLAWLPATLPRHVRLIVSTTPGECLTALERELPAESRIELEPMPIDEGSELLDLWLKQAGRTLQSDQRREVLEQFKLSAAGTESGTTDAHVAGGLPLYLKLAFEQARHWTSSGLHQPLPPDVAGIIRDLFRRLSDNANHGVIMVSRSLAYLAASKNGLSEDELLDVLTLDDDVFRDFEHRSRHRPPERRLPVVMWSRLFFDLEPYLAERAADGASLLTFYHRQLNEVVQQDYLSDRDKVARHGVLAAYFAARPLFEEDVPNVRKLSELPFQQTSAEQWAPLYATLTDFDFLEAKCTHVGVVMQGRGPEARKVYGGVYELQEDYRRALAKLPAT